MIGYFLLIAWIFAAVRLSKIQVEPLFFRKKEFDANRKFLVLASVGIILLTGLRSISVGPDSDAYSSYIYNLHQGMYLSGYERFEKGFEWFSKAIAFMTGNYTIYFLIIAAIIMMCYALLIRRSAQNYFWPIYLYITIGPFVFQLTGLRQAMAMAICAASVIFVQKKKPIPFILLVLLAAQFHTSAYVFLPLYFLGSIRLGSKSFFLFLGGVAGILFANEQIISVSNQLLGYDKGYENAPGGIVSILLYVGTVVLAMLYKDNLFSDNMLKSDDKKELQQAQYNTIVFNMSLISLLMLFMRYWMRTAERASKYYQIGIILLLANTICSIKDDRTRKVVKAIVGLLAIALFIYRQSKDGSAYVYSFFWQ